MFVRLKNPVEQPNPAIRKTNSKITKKSKGNAMAAASRNSHLRPAGKGLASALADNPPAEGFRGEAGLRLALFLFLPNA